MYNAIFHPCQHFTLPATKAQTNTGSKQMPINGVLCDDLQGAQRNIPVCKQQQHESQQNTVCLSKMSSFPPTWKMRSQF